MRTENKMKIKLQKLIHLDKVYIYIHTYIHIYIYNRTSSAQMHELPQSHCGDNREAHCFHDCIYIYIKVHIYICIHICIYNVYI